MKNADPLRFRLGLGPTPSAAVRNGELTCHSRVTEQNVRRLVCSG